MKLKDSTRRKVKRLSAIRRYIEEENLKDYKNPRNYTYELDCIRMAECNYNLLLYRDNDNAKAIYRLEKLLKELRPIVKEIEKKNKRKVKSSG